MLKRFFMITLLTLTGFSFAEIKTVDAAPTTTTVVAAKKTNTTPVPNDNQAVIKWTQQIIKPFFFSDEIEKVKAWFSEKTWPEAKTIREELDVKNFGKIELEQQAVIDNVPVWRVIINISAIEKGQNKPANITLRALILKNTDGSFKITHIDKFEKK